MHSSYYKWNMAIICNPPIMLCATFVPCFMLWHILPSWQTFHDVFLTYLWCHNETLTYHTFDIISLMSWHYFDLKTFLIQCITYYTSYWRHDVTLTSWRIFDFMMNFLAPPAERQRSFCNADSSVVRRPSSSVVCRRRRRPSSTFQLKAWFLKNCLITFFLFWYVASLGWYQCIVKIWIWLNHPKGHFERSERSNLAPFLLGGNFLKNCLITFSLFM